MLNGIHAALGTDPTTIGTIHPRGEDFTFEVYLLHTFKPAIPLPITCQSAC